MQGFGVPIDKGGKARKNYQPIVIYGDGLFIPGAALGALTSVLAEPHAACTIEGRRVEDIELTTMWSPKDGEEFLKIMAGLGIQQVEIIAGDHLEAIK